MRKKRFNTQPNYESGGETIAGAMLERFLIKEKRSRGKHLKVKI